MVNNINILTISMKNDLLQEIEKKRGDIPRSIFIRKLIIKGLKFDNLTDTEKN